MKRDMDLVRKILLMCEGWDACPSSPRLDVAGYTREQVTHHMYLMMQAGLIEGGTLPSAGRFPGAWASSLTWAGHDFLEAARDDQRWVKARSAAEAAGGLTLDVLKGTLVALASAAVKKAVGLP